VKEAKNLASSIQRDTIKISAVVDLLRTLTIVAREDKGNSSDRLLTLCEASQNAFCRERSQAYVEGPINARSITILGPVRTKRFKPITELIRGGNARKKPKAIVDFDGGGGNVEEPAVCGGSFVEDQALSGIKRNSTCTFCNNIGHRKLTCKKRMNFGRYLNKGVEKETFSTELTSTTSTILPPLSLGVDEGNKSILESIPKSTNHVVVLGKYVINPFVDKSTEDNMAISIYCIGNDGERLRQPYNGSILIMAGKLRKWVSQNAKNVDKIILPHEKAMKLHSQSSVNPH
jgi:hypothetical protein